MSSFLLARGRLITFLLVYALPETESPVRRRRPLQEVRECRRGLSLSGSKCNSPDFEDKDVGLPLIYIAEATVPESDDEFFWRPLTSVHAA